MSNNVLLKIKKKLIKLTDTYEIQKDGKTYATIRKEMFTMFREKYIVNIDDFDDAALLLACTIAIAMICHHDCEENSNS